METARLHLERYGREGERFFHLSELQMKSGFDATSQNWRDNQTSGSTASP